MRQGWSYRRAEGLHWNCGQYLQEARTATGRKRYAMTDHQVVSAEPDERWLRSSREGAALLRLPRGTVSGPRPAECASDRDNSQQEHGRTSAAHCYFAMHYED